ncbi:uncharacterized protein LOC144448269 isoform X2 [Glandiceps talaboti]
MAFRVKIVCLCIVLHLLTSVKAADVGATGLTITDAATTTYSATATTIAFTVDLTQDATNGGIAVTGVKLYITNGDGASPSVETEVTGLTGTLTTTDTATSIPGLGASITLDDITKCAAYTHVCVEILDSTNADSNAANNRFCIPFGTGADQAGTKTCPGGNCLALTIPTGVKVTPDNTLTSGTIVAITCVTTGETLSDGDASRTCTDGVWSGTMPTGCGSASSSTNCPVLTAPTNGSLSSTAVTSGTKVMVTCDSGFKRCGDAEITCMTDKKWSGEVATCTDGECNGDSGAIPALNKFLAWNMVIVVLALLTT